MNIKELIEIATRINTVYIGDGQFDELACEHRMPASAEEIAKLERIAGTLPADYRDFLMQTNGMTFFQAGDFSLYSIDEIIETLKTADFKEGIYPIGYILEDYIVIKGDVIDSGAYIYAGDAYCRDEYYSLDCDFKTFLDRLIISGGNNFWRWVNPGLKYDFHND